MRLIDAEELRRALAEDPFPVSEVWEMHIDAAPTVDVPQPLTRDGVLAEVARIEAAGDTAVVEVLWPVAGKWGEVDVAWVKCWLHPDVPSWNVRVRAVPAETEDVPLTQLVGRTIAGEAEPVAGYLGRQGATKWWPAGETSRDFPEGTLNLETGQVAVRPKAAT